MLFDLHVHSRISPCSELAIRDILAHGVSRGLDGVCITDHDTMEAAGFVRQGVQDDGLMVVVGMEYTTREGDFLLFGDVGSVPPDLPALELLGQVRALGGAAVAAHPCRSWRPVQEGVLGSGLCGLAERVNGRNTEMENLRAARLADRYGLQSTGGSDAHSLDELGLVTTRILAPVREPGDLVDALARGLCEPGPSRPLLEPFHAAYA